MDVPEIEKSKAYAKILKEHLLCDIMPFWENRCLDREYGGFLTCFDRQGCLTDNSKYTWFQGRQLYVYSKLFNKVERRPAWLEHAAWGYNFLIKHAYAGEGRWHFKLDQSGNVLVSTTSIYSDYHAAQGLAEYMLAAEMKNEEGMQILAETYDRLEKNTTDPGFKDIYENTWSPFFIWNDMYLTALNVACIASPILGVKRTAPLMDECASKIMNWFARDEYSLVFEAVTRDNKVLLEGEGRFINPGHSFESAWFLFEAGGILNNRKMLERGLQIVDWTYEAAFDKANGGIYSYLDAEGGEPQPLDWHKETNSLWDDKVWWVNSEALCAFANAFALSGEQKYLKMFENQWNFCKANFHDSEFGEWYERLNPDGSVKVSDKGTPWKCAFHLARSLIMAIAALDQAF
jgi:N-acylglucosamine 2-epimerase